MHSNAIILCGLDEAGRGPLAGPIVACGVILHSSFTQLEKLSGIKIRDGKLLSSIQREKVFRILTPSLTTIYPASISVSGINRYGIGWANKELFRRLIRKIPANRFVIDGNLHISVRNSAKYIQSIVDADATIPEVILAGICAKVIRDRMMQRLSLRYPLYGWNRNAGYGTTLHLEAITKNGITPLHRTLFVRTALSTKSSGKTINRQYHKNGFPGCPK